ncbi:MAG: chromosome segregation protein SMC [Firmicutes bacterium]|nr:chromosome segregation protein SMC [Bacillota bacterium]
MQLTKLEVYGFKSFSERTELNFSPGITAFVGPNGCGKSNVVDAIRWVLGEQNPRTIRANKMEDVFFAGSQKSLYKNYAEVSIVLDNSHHTLPLDFNEITLTRRLYRSGESEYFINRVPCRLKDIQELLATASLGKGTYAIIGQGQVEEVINSRPEERRLMFEEAAGISVYKIRKKDAFKKLSDTRANLTRLEDIIHELDAQQADLAAGAQRARRFLQLKDEYDKLELVQWANRYSDLTEKLTEQADNKTAALAIVDGKNNELAALASNLQHLSQQLSSVQEQASGIRQKKTKLASDITAADYQLRLANERLQDYLTMRSKSEEEMHKLQAEILDLQQHVEAEKKKVFQFSRQKELFNTALDRNQRVLEAIRRIDAKLTSYLSRTDNEIIGAVTQSSKATSDQDQAKVLAAELTEQVKSLSERLQHHQQELALQRRTIDAETNKKADLTKQNHADKLRLEAIKQQISELEQNRAQIADTHQRARNHIDGLKQQVQVISTMDADYEGYGYGPRNVLQAAGKGKLSGIIGAVAEIIKVKKPDYTLAVETALGASMQNIVCQDDVACQKAIEYLKQSGRGRATFIPQTVNSHPRTNSSLPTEAVGIAADLVEYDSKLQPVVNMLLGNVLVVNKLEDAVKIARQANQRYKIVTIEGDIINRGFYTGGAPSKNKGGILQRKARLQRLATEIRLGEEQLKTAHEKLLNQDKELAEKRAARAEVSARLERSQEEVLSLNAKLQRLQAEFEQQEQREQELKELLIQEQTKLGATQAIINSLDSEVSSGQVNLKQLQSTKNKLQAYKSEIEAQHTLWSSAENRLQLTLLSIKNEEQNAEQQLRQLHKQITSVESQLETNQEAQARYQQQIEGLDAQIANLQATGRENRSMELKLESELSALESEAVSIQLKLDEGEQARSAIEAEISRIRSSIHEADLKQARWQAEKEALEKELAEKFRIDCQSALAHKDSALGTTELNRRLKAIKTEILDLGEVNIAAIKQYDKFRERLQFLSSQRNDLLAAEQDITTLIQELDAKISEMFSETFSQVQKNFTEIFKTLFRGGTAYLSLSNQEDLFESGVEIFAQPPGKRIQSLSLLSGGEKAMTAIALLFALLSVKPVPFCILDEIEAALDDVNIVRFAGYLSKLAESMQFILITHRRETMEHAHSLYGVTIDTAGSSRLISVTLNNQSKKGDAVYGLA